MDFVSNNKKKKKKLGAKIFSTSSCTATSLWITIIVGVVVGLFMFQRTHSILFPIFLGMFAWQAFQALQENRWR